VEISSLLSKVEGVAVVAAIYYVNVMEENISRF
jgi:hypothetical protein